MAYRNRTKPKNMLKFAMVISKTVNDIDEVNLKLEGHGSLLYKIASECKRSCNSQFKKQMRNLWNKDYENSLKSMVNEILKKTKQINNKKSSSSSPVSLIYEEDSGPNSTSTDLTPSKKKLNTNVSVTNKYELEDSGIIKDSTNLYDSTVKNEKADTDTNSKLSRQKQYKIMSKNLRNKRLFSELTNSCDTSVVKPIIKKQKKNV